MVLRFAIEVRLDARTLVQVLAIVVMFLN